jgi:hypothetical protein
MTHGFLEFSVKPPEIVFIVARELVVHGENVPPDVLASKNSILL